MIFMISPYRTLICSLIYKHKPIKLGIKHVYLSNHLTLMHCLCPCEFAEQFWESSPMSHVLQWDRYQSFLEWVWHVMNNGDKTNLGLFIALCWGLWTNRNEANFCNRQMGIEHIVGMVFRLSG